MAASSSSAADPAEIPSGISLFIHEINAVYQRVKAEFAVPSVPVTVGPPKSSHLAKTYRSRGVKLMLDPRKENRKSSEAIELITRSIALALENSQDLAIAYADRSMVFFEVGQFELCLFDINRSLMNENCPTPMKSILLERKRKCLSRITQSVADGETETSYTIEGNETNPINSIFDVPSVRWCDEFDNPRIPDASSKIELRYNETWGRHIVASKDIQAGDILSAEQFFSFGVPPDGRYVFNYWTKQTTLSKWEETGLGYYDHCSHCAKRCKGLIPCPSCTAFLFCSEECRQLAYDSYHRTECQMGALYWLGDSVCTLPYFLAVRTLLVGTKQGATLGELMKRLTLQDIFEAKLDPQSETFEMDYKTLLKLSTNVNQFLIRSRMEHAVQVVIVLRSLGYFKQVPKDVLRGERRRDQRMNHAEIFVTALLLNHFNTEKLYEFLEPKYITVRDGQLYPANPIILGTLVLHTLVNHACDPNADFFVSKRQHVLYAKRPIKEGEQIFFSYYGQTYWLAVKGGRPDVLQLPFSCQCDACINDWPTSMQLYQEQTFKVVTGIRESSFIRTLKRLAAPILKSEPERRLGIFEIREIIISIFSIIHKHTEKPNYVVLLFDQYLSIYTRLLYDEVIQKDNILLDHGNELELWLNRRDSSSVSREKKTIRAYCLAINRKLISFAIEYLRKTRV